MRDRRGARTEGERSHPTQGENTLWALNEDGDADIPDYMMRDFGSAEEVDEDLVRGHE